MTPFETDVSSAPLKGIDKIYVLVEDLPKDAALINLSEERLRTVTELKLRKEGIKVVGKKERIAQILPCLYVNVNVAWGKFQRCTYAQRGCYYIERPIYFLLGNNLVFHILRHSWK